MTQTTEYKQPEQAMQVLVNQLFEAFNFFNRALWSGLLPPVAIMIGEKRGSRGVFKPNHFVPKNLELTIDDGLAMHEILMNPTDFNRSELEVLSTFVHEMVHLYEEEHGNHSKNGYHNRQWAASMKKIGLYPSTTGEPGGNETGRKVSHYIVEGGLFHQYAIQFIEEYQFSINWVVLEKSRKASTPRKRTYRCACPQPWYSNLSGRKATCGKCNEEFEEDDL